MTVEVIDAATGAVRPETIVLDPQTHSGELSLEVAPGASSVQVVARNGSAVAAWIEVQAQPGEQVLVEFRQAPSGELRAFSRNRDFLVLPDEEPPKPLLFKPRQSDELDLVVLVDGTCLHPFAAAGSSSPLEYLLAPPLSDVWRDITGKLAEFATSISAKYSKLWAFAAAFGDEPLPFLSNELLKPKYLVYPPIPGGRKLERCSVDQLVQQLRKLPPTPGGDFVDGLADGLRACAQAQWRHGSRKLLLIFGQSPGYSLSDSWDDMTNLAARKTCVEEEILVLHELGVETVTIYHDPAGAEESYGVQLPEVFERTRKQYQRLASLREWTGTSPEIDVARLAAAWLNPPVSLARGPSPGLLASAPNP